MQYWMALGIVSALVMGLEALFPWRRSQKQLRRTLWSDLVYLVFNGHYLGVVLAIIADRIGLGAISPIGFAASWPLWLQIPVLVIVFDFIQWCVHRLLHSVPFLWKIHQVHHSVVDGEMDWIVSFRFHFLEVVVYKAAQYLPLLFFGFAAEAIMVQAVAGTLIGHLNHSNLNLGHGWWRYVINSPRMHIWHHDYDAPPGETKNFGIVFSCWDWIFGTAKMPDHPPRKLGFEGVETYPTDFFRMIFAPSSRNRSSIRS